MTAAMHVVGIVFLRGQFVIDVGIEAIRAITKMIAMPFSPQKSQAIREAEAPLLDEHTVLCG